MKKVKLDNGNIKLVAEDGYIVQSKATYFDEEKEQNVPNIESKIIYLGKNDSEDNYIEIENNDFSN
ncbi:MAG: hypothetical protein K2P14_10255 [Anaeroplasmataceae bacterium]|nr:hypothetical protein [Anaeroplasmataceae bacterium]